MNEDINVVALSKNKEKYVFLYNDANILEILNFFGNYASNPELSFTWYDAAILTKIVQYKLKK